MIGIMSPAQDTERTESPPTRPRNGRRGSRLRTRRWVSRCETSPHRPVADRPARARAGAGPMIVRPVAGGVEVLAPAKLNLFLEIRGRGPTAITTSSR